jgi:hypothetical protein
MDWPILLQIVTLLTVAFSSAFTGWIALKQAELRANVARVDTKTDVMVTQSAKTEQKMDTLSTQINGHVAKLVESQIAVGKLAGIAQEQARVHEQNKLQVIEHADAARVLTTDAQQVAAKVIADAETLAGQKVILAQDVARLLMAAAVPEKPEK